MATINCSKIDHVPRGSEVESDVPFVMPTAVPRLSPAYPTPHHERAAAAVVAHFAAVDAVEAVLLCGACARGKATHDGDLDVVVLSAPDITPQARETLEARWQVYHESDAVFAALRQAGAYAFVDAHFTDGAFAPGPHGWTTGPDDFELEIGNTPVYSVPLWQCTGRSAYLAALREQWLPYYPEPLRLARLAEARKFCVNNLDHIPLFVERGLYFQSLGRLWHAFQEFLQALFTMRRTYPIAYDKWVREQVEEILGLPDLYRQLPPLFEFSRFESRDIVASAAALRRLLDQFAPAATARTIESEPPARVQ
jgi:hypothetical protein